VEVVKTSDGLMKAIIVIIVIVVVLATIAITSYAYKKKMLCYIREATEQWPRRIDKFFWWTHSAQKKVAIPRKVFPRCSFFPKSLKCWLLRAKSNQQTDLSMFRMFRQTRAPQKLSYQPKISDSIATFFGLWDHIWCIMALKTLLSAGPHSLAGSNIKDVTVVSVNELLTIS